MAPGSSLEDQARDPLTDQHMLYRLASEHPELRPLIAANPNTYQALLEWLGDLGDPQVDAALEARQAAQEVAALPEPTEIIAAPIAPTLPPVYQPTEPGPIIQRNPVMPRDRGYEAPAFPVAQQPQYEPPRQAPVQALPAAAVAEPRKRHGALTFAFVALALLAIAAAGIAVYVFLGGGDTGAAPASSPEPSPSATESPTQEAPTPSPSPEIKYPAPEGAAAFSWFSSPSGNIACRLGADSTQCTIFENNYQANGFRDCDSNVVNLVIDQSGAKMSCSGESVTASSDVLVYNAATASGNFSCTSSENGINCWDIYTGASFALARDGWQTSNAGPIEKFDWVK